MSGTPSANPYGLTPARISAAYGFGDISFDEGIHGDGTGQTIAIVVAYNQPNIASDLAYFDQTYKLPAPPSFTIYPSGSNSGVSPAPPGDWGVEASLDVEWAHALAPGADILLVEAASDSATDLFSMVNYARVQPGVSVTSMSFAIPEFSTETSFDHDFLTPVQHIGVTFIAGSGDSGSSVTEYPASSPNVLAVGGTTLTTDAAGDYVSETAWPDGGGGASLFETNSTGNNPFQATTAARTTPDVSFNAGNPVSIYDSYDFGAKTGWSTAEGTSVGVPSWSALVAIADQGNTLEGNGSFIGAPYLGQTPQNEIITPQLFNLAQQNSTGFHDIKTGSNGNPAGIGYDLATGLGSPIAETIAERIAKNIGTPVPTSPVPAANTPMAVITTPTPTFTWAPSRARRATR
jgi:subtilase family serine protease